MWIFLTGTNSQRYIDVLQDIMQGYNSSYHWSFKMKPVNVDKENEGVDISKCQKFVLDRSSRVMNRTTQNYFSLYPCVSHVILLYTGCLIMTAMSSMRVL